MRLAANVADTYKQECSTESQAVVDTCYEGQKAALNGVKSYVPFIKQKEEMSPVKCQIMVLFLIIILLGQNHFGFIEEFYGVSCSGFK